MAPARAEARGSPHANRATRKETLTLTIHVHHYLHIDGATDSPIGRLLELLTERIDLMSVAIDRLTASVAAERGAVESVKVALAGLTAEMRSHAGDEAAILALADDVDAQTAELAGAVQENPSQEPPTAPPA